MTFLRQLHFGSRQMLREWRAGELRVLLIALVVGIASHTAIGHFADRVGRAMQHDANQVVGGDLVVAGVTPLAQEIGEAARAQGLRVAEVRHFTSVLNVGDMIVLGGVKAVGAHYPLKGQVRVADTLYGQSRALDSGPARGELWAEARVFRSLGVEPGAEVNLGDSRLRLTRVLTYEPDRSGQLYSLLPRVMMHFDDLPATGILQPGSRVWSRTMFAGTPQAVAGFEPWLAERLGPEQELRTLKTSRPATAEALDRARQYLNLASLAALLLAAVAVASAGRQYSERHYTFCALLRCLGCSQHDILMIFLAQLLFLALLGGGLGVLLGLAVQGGLIALIVDLLPPEVPGPGLGPSVSGLALAVVVLLGFTLPAVLRLRRVPPMRTLRRELAPLPPAAWAVRGGSLALVAGLMWAYTGDWRLTVLIAVAGGGLMVLGWALLGVLFAGLVRALEYLPDLVRQALRQFLRRRNQAIAQTLALGIAVMAMLVVWLLRTELLGLWQTDVARSAANHVAINIQPDEAEAFRTALHDSGATRIELYPMVRGRIATINGLTEADYLTARAPGEEAEEEFDDTFNMTWLSDLPPDNTLLAGEWWAEGGEIPQVSVEQGVAADLGLKVGDRIEFSSGGLRWQAEVTSLRSVRWENLRANFYMIFRPGDLADLPYTWFASFHLEPAQKPALVALNRAFPGLSLIELDVLINQVQKIIDQLSLLLQTLLGFVLLAGLTIVLAALHTSWRERLHEGAVWRVLGAGRARLRARQLAEFACLGILAGGLGAAAAEAGMIYLSRQWFALPYTPSVLSFTALPLGLALLLMGVGWRSSRRIAEAAPLAALRDE